MKPTLVFNFYCIFATQRTNNMKYDSPYFEFIENNHPQYYSDDPSFFLND